MKREYPVDEWLPLSGIQHFIFCRRQWALIHVEHQWIENVHTAEGRHLHRRADDPFFNEKRKAVIISRSVPVSSPWLGLTGICDVVEFTASPDGVWLHTWKGKYLPVPVEYKRGRQKISDCDRAQLCAQAICLEDMLGVNIEAGYVFYAQTRRREPVPFTEELRSLVFKASDEMHHYHKRGYTPKVKPSKACRSCSLVDICLPDMQAFRLSVSEYIRQQIEMD